MQSQSIPLFVQVAETIKTRIFGHEYSPGGSIPSAKELENEFKVSNITIRRAIEQLTRAGYIVPRRGMRAQVAEQINDIVEIEITGDFRTWVDTAIGRKLGITAEIIDRQVIVCPKPICEILALDPTEKIERIKRVRKLKENPISYYVNYGPSHLLTKLSNREIESRTFIETYQDVSKIKLKFMEQRVQATSADMDLAGILQVDFGFPLFFVQNVYYSDNEIPMVVTHMYYRSDRYVYTVKRSL
jgi:DNA-binding GntR family transcriptional regulator